MLLATFPLIVTVVHALFEPCLERKIALVGYLYCRFALNHIHLTLF
jgi:hypothetical protein